MSTEKFVVSSSPHVSSKSSVRKIMLDVIIALSPCLVASIVFFGLYALMVTAISVASCVLFEYLYNLLRRKPATIGDLSAVVTGLILAFNLPPTVPFYVPILGGLFAIVIVKMLFGGLGKNFANPAATARIFLVLSFTASMTNWIDPINYSQGFWSGMTQGFRPLLDGTTGATPLVGEQNLLHMFLGYTGGCIGETSALAILIGFGYLLIRKVIDYKIPIVFVLSALALTYIFTGDVTKVMPALLGGGLMFGAVFMSTDYSTSPNSTNAQLVYAFGLGFFTVLIRLFSTMPEGVSFAILFMNLLVPILDKYIYNKPFGTVKRDNTLIIILSVFALILIGVAITAIVAICRG